MSKSKHKATFRSYIKENGSQAVSSPDESPIQLRGIWHYLRDKLEARGRRSVPQPLSQLFPGVVGPEVEPEKLKGEIIISKAQKVIKYTPYTEPERTKGVTGVLFCSNYRISFLSYTRLLDEEGVEPPQRNKLLREDDISLANVDAIYQVSGGKKKRIQPGSGSIGAVKILEIQCKDFKIVQFGLESSPKKDAKSIVDAIVHHAFPQRLELIFAFDYQGETGATNSGGQPPMFDTPEDWLNELSRQEVQEKKWRLLVWNQEYRDCQSMPVCGVYPAGVTEADVKKAAPQFIGNRPPMWCYTHTNGASLIRMAHLIPETTQRQFEARAHQKRLLQAIKDAHPNLKPAEMIDLSSPDYPSLRDISSSYQKLREILMPGSKKDLELGDNSWYSSIEDTRWLANVTMYLQCAKLVITKMEGRGLSVILKDESGTDAVCVVACLVQILMDPYYRTLEGFQSLVQREWVAMGHPFCRRMNMVYKGAGEQCPVFLVFLDSVWQLLQQFPSAFQFSETYLTSLWDSVCLGMFQQFLYNSLHDHAPIKRRYSDISSYSGNKLLSVWDWDQQFSMEEQVMFRNPLYMARTGIIPAACQNQSNSDLQSNDSIGSESYPDVLYPIAKAPFIKIWSQCYLRWLSPLYINQGGPPSEFIQQCVLIDDILSLKEQLQEINLGNTDGLDDDVQKPEPGVKVQLHRQSSRQWTENLTSAFPFVSTPGQSAAEIMASPLRRYRLGSIISETWDNQSLDFSLRSSSDIEDSQQSMTSRDSDGIPLPTFV